MKDYLSIIITDGTNEWQYQGVVVPSVGQQVTCRRDESMEVVFGGEVENVHWEVREGRPGMVATVWLKPVESSQNEILSQPTSSHVSVSREQKEFVLLSIISAMGGETDSSEGKWQWLNWFCDDENHQSEHDTFNRCGEKGWLRTTHNSDFDTSTTVITPEGRAALAAWEASELDGVSRSVTARGFALLKFTDRNGVECSLQESSLATESAIWLGADSLSVKRFADDGEGWQDVDFAALFPGQHIVGNERMHLTQEQVRYLLPYLQHFAQYGDLDGAEDASNG